MSGGKEGGKGCSNLPARQSTGNLTNDKNDGKNLKGGKGGTKKVRQAAEGIALPQYG